jgi:alkaline phosphatase
LGGGRLQFLTRDEADPESSHLSGYRQDLNLIDVWKSKYKNNSVYVQYREELLKVDVEKVDHLLGLFGPSHLGYFDELEGKKDPSLEEMVEVAVKILEKNPKGFFLFVEGNYLINLI